MKKILSLLVIATLTLSFASIASGCVETTTEPSVDTNSQSAEKETVAKEDTSNKLGDYTVEIKGCRLAKDYEGKDVVIVKFLYTNVSNDTPTSFTSAINAEVFQDGVGLNTAIIIDEDVEYNADDSLKDIKKGASLEVEQAYNLNDTTTDIEVEISEWFSFDDTVITKTFSLQ